MNLLQKNLFDTSPQKMMQNHMENQLKNKVKNQLRNQFNPADMLGQMKKGYKPGPTPSFSQNGPFANQNPTHPGQS